MEQCSKCGKLISDDEWVVNWTSCSDCFNENLPRCNTCDKIDTNLNSNGQCDECFYNNGWRRDSETDLDIEPDFF